eukprot:CAMPEP_0117021674 /NCGR_PEP_ID=MMETSP0472-20121206/16332_1 /TAXON_ID=693140 ORGANISM="Tiarina fusus, Strain LIS" /NCGR_SAMPLE_ID=MMETSP0472 /ASSEMBLY_ACC=CAM_ASM_000603 /LENGTH=131 /DNA_ID=CAMNT_0004727235 /DNA_START=39 /DNA_END=434 /DNA_ORIENTATION=+
MSPTASLANFEQEFKDPHGNVQFSQHFWVQDYEISASARSLDQFFAVCRGWMQDGDDDSDTDDGNSDTGDDESGTGDFEVPEVASSHEELVAVTTSLEEARRIAGTCCLSLCADDDDMTDEPLGENGTWVS